MKKITIFVLILVSVLSLPVLFSYADDDAVEPKIQAQTVLAQPLAQVATPPARVATPPVQTLPKLVNLVNAQNEDQIRDLEGRINDLEREGRSQDERIRNIERTVNDLRRAR